MSSGVVPFGTESRATAFADECPHQRRATEPTVVEPTQSTETISCPSGIYLNLREINIGGSAPASTCPEWTTSGLTYHPKVAAHGMKVVDEMLVENTVTHYYCDDETWLFGLIVSFECKELNTNVTDTQITALSDAPCPTIGPETGPTTGGRGEVQP